MERLTSGGDGGLYGREFDVDDVAECLLSVVRDPDRAHLSRVVERDPLVVDRVPLGWLNYEHSVLLPAGQEGREREGRTDERAHERPRGDKGGF